MTAGQEETLAAVRSIRLEKRHKAGLAARAAAEPPRQGLLALLGTVMAMDDRPGDPPALMGIHDHPELDEVVVELAHRTQRRPS